MPNKEKAVKNLGNILHNRDNGHDDPPVKKIQKTPTVEKPKRIIPKTAYEQRIAEIKGNVEKRDRKDSPNYSDDAMLRLVNLIYDPMSTALLEDCGIDPDEAHLLGLTRVNSSKEAWMWAQQITKESAFGKYVLGVRPKMSLTQIRRIAFLLARRSIPGDCGPGFMLGVGLAQEQNITKSEEEVEGQDW